MSVSAQFLDIFGLHLLLPRSQLGLRKSVFFPMIICLFNFVGIPGLKTFLHMSISVQRLVPFSTIQFLCGHEHPWRSGDGRWVNLVPKCSAT